VGLMLKIDNSEKELYNRRPDIRIWKRMFMLTYLGVFWT
jgi:hypothetical protein